MTLTNASWQTATAWQTQLVGNTPGSRVCECNNGYFKDGDICSNIDECKLGMANCSRYASCEDTAGAYECTCDDGWKGDGVHCVDVDECSAGTHDCSSNAECSNYNGTFSCTCKSGYGGNGQICTSLDECALQTDDCGMHAECVDTEASFLCSCTNGWSGIGTEDDRCVDINECTNNSHDCHAQAACTNNDGSFKCACNKGWEADEGTQNGTQCSNINECVLQEAHVCQLDDDAKHPIAYFDSFQSRRDVEPSNELGETASVARIKDCSERCLDDKRCVAFGYRKSNRFCALKLATAAWFTTLDASDDLINEEWDYYVLAKTPPRTCEPNLPLNNCDANAQCEDSDGSFTCACQVGYEGVDGTLCASTTSTTSSSSTSTSSSRECTDDSSGHFDQLSPESTSTAAYDITQRRFNGSSVSSTAATCMDRCLNIGFQCDSIVYNTDDGLCYAAMAGHAGITTGPSRMRRSSCPGGDLDQFEQPVNNQRAAAQYTIAQHDAVADDEGCAAKCLEASGCLAFARSGKTGACRTYNIGQTGEVLATKETSQQKHYFLRTDCPTASTSAPASATDTPATLAATATVTAKKNTTTEVATTSQQTADAALVAYARTLYCERPERILVTGIPKVLSLTTDAISVVVDIILSDHRGVSSVTATLQQQDRVIGSIVTSVKPGATVWLAEVPIVASFKPGTDYVLYVRVAGQTLEPQVALPSFASDKITALESRITIDASVDGGTGFSTSQFNSVAMTAYQATGVSGLGSNSIEVTIGGESTQAAVSSISVAAESVTAVVLNEIVYHDDNVIRVAVQAKDGLFNSPSKWRAIKIVATPSAALAAVDARTVSGSCSRAANGQGGAGLCVITIGVRDAWFVGDVGDASRTVSLAYGFADTSESTWSTVEGAVALHRKTAVSAGKNIVAYVPSRPIYPGGTFDVDVYATFDHLLETFTIDFGVDSALQIKGFTLSSKGKWSGTAANTGKIATLSYLRDGSGLDKNGGQSPELLATMRVQVLNDAPVSSLASVFVSHNGTSNVLDETVIPQSTSVIVGRHSSSRSGSGSVYVQENVLRGVFASARSAALVNTAVLDGKRVTSAIEIVGVRLNGRVSSIGSSDLVCASSDESVLVADCEAAEVNAKHRAGSPRVGVSISHVDSGLSTSLDFSVWAPTLPVAMSPVDARLQAVRGWHSADDCGARYQQTRMLATTTFSTTGLSSSNDDLGWQGSVFEADVTETLRGRWRAIGSAGGVAVASIINGDTVVGHAAGSADISAVGADGLVLGSASVVVDSTPIGVIALDAHVVHGFSATMKPAGGTKYAQPFEAVNIDVAIDSSPLAYEGDSAQVVVDVIFDDMRRMTLSNEMGLVLTSTAEGSVVIEDGRYAVVPFMGSSGAGDLVKAAWVSSGFGRCNATSTPVGGVIATGHAFANVSLPKAISASVRVVGAASSHSPALFVVPGGAASTAGLATRAQIIVELVYADRTVDATSDPRTVFNLSDVSGMFRVDAASKQIESVGGVGVGGGTIHVTFQHEDVVAAIPVELAAMSNLVVSATPYPEYPGSQDVDAATLSPIGGSSPTKYEQAKLHLTMQLTNGHSLELPSTSAVFLSMSSAVRVAGSIIVPSGQGSARVIGSFAGETSTLALVMAVSNTKVYVERITNVVVKQGRAVLSDNRALRGGKGTGRAATKVAVVLENGRQLPALFDDAGPPLVPGLVTFTTDTASAVSVDSASGVVTLRGNHWSSVSVTASIAGPSGSRIERGASFACNLDPQTSGDVDLGAADAHPLKSRRVNEVFQVPLRVNTGGLFLGTFDIYVFFDSSILTITDPKTAVTFNGNKKEIGSGILDAVVDGDALHFSGSIDTNTLRSQQALLVNIKFKAIGEGVAQLGGKVELLGSTSVPAQDIAVRGSTFVAGQVFQRVGSGRRDRRG